MDLEHKYKDKIIAVLSALFPDAKIILYGSRARGTHTPRSDIDIALDAGRKLDRFDVIEAKDMLTESNIPYNIDIVDINNISGEFRKEILKDGKIWKS